MTVIDQEPEEVKTEDPEVSPEVEEDEAESEATVEESASVEADEKEEVVPSTIEELKSILEGRSEFYLTLGGFYFSPLTQEQIDAMAQVDYSVYDAGESLLAEGFNDIWRFLRKRNTGTRQTLAVDFTTAFGGMETWKGKASLPISSIFLSEHGLLYQGSRNDVFTLYKRQALKLNSKANMPEDHLTYEFEFLSILSQRVIKALDEKDKKTAIEELRLSRRFIAEHILTWMPLFADLANRLIKSRFYRGVLKITEGYLILDIETIDDLIEEIESDVK
jgi:TorA maturation chaperone TorD